jgi:hypothetical protein
MVILLPRDLNILGKCKRVTVYFQKKAQVKGIAKKRTMDRQGIRNYGGRMNGQWVVGISWHRSEQRQEKHGQGFESRYFYVERRDRATLHGLIRCHVKVDAVVCTDEWKAYKTLEQFGFVHAIVKKQEAYVDEQTELYTQLMEALWNRLCFRIAGQARGVGDNLPQ